MSSRTFDPTLYLVTDRRSAYSRDWLGQILAAVHGGCTMVQVREKEVTTRMFIELAQQVKELLSPYSIPLIINDRIDVALAVDADGVHIGQEDMPYSLARQLLGKEKIIGLSVEDLDQVVQANELDVDYIGVSPVFSTPTKTDTAHPFGLEGVRQSVRISRHPVIGIGGMNRCTAADVIRQGVSGLAVVSELMGAEHPDQVAQEMLTIINAQRRQMSQGVNL